MTIAKSHNNMGKSFLLVNLKVSDSNKEFLRLPIIKEATNCTDTLIYG